MKVFRLLPCLAAGLALAACKDDGPTFVNNGPQAYVRFVNASPDSPNVTARFIDKVENMFTWDRVGYRGNSGNYIAVNSGTRNLRVFLSGQGSATTVDSASTVLLDTTVTLQPLTYYTMVMSGRVLPKRGTAPNNASVTVFTDTLPSTTTADTATIFVRAYHFADGTGPVDVLLNKSVVVPADTTATPPRPVAVTTDSAVAGTVTGLAFGARSRYLSVGRIRAADTLNLYRTIVRATGTTTNVISVRPNVIGIAGAAASATSPALDPVAGVRQGRSVMSLFIFPAAVAGTPARITATAVPTVDLIQDQAPPRP